MKSKILILLAVAGVATAAIAAMIPGQESCTTGADCRECPECPVSCCPSACK